MNIPYFFVMKMQDGNLVQISAVGVMVVERRGDIESTIVHLLNPKVIGRVPEGFKVDDMELLEGS